MGNQTTPTLAPIIVVQMLGSATLSGLGTSILGVSRLIIAYPVGWLTDRYGRKAGLMLGLGADAGRHAGDRRRRCCSARSRWSSSAW